MKQIAFGARIVETAGLSLSLIALCFSVLIFFRFRYVIFAVNSHGHDKTGAVFLSQLFLCQTKQTRICCVACCTAFVRTMDVGFVLIGY